MSKVVEKVVDISAPNFGTAVFKIIGTAPLVIHRFSKKIADDFGRGMEAPNAKKGAKTKREPVKLEDIYNEGRYISDEGWDGFNASAIRSGMISVCRLVNYKMTLAKMSVFVVQDGWDKIEPQIPLVRIYGNPVMQKDIGRVATGNSYLIVRPAYHNWHAEIKIRWDNDQFTIDNITNLLNRVGQQCGIGEGRPDSKKSCGMGWGTFEVERVKK